ncbi:MAG TPA: methyltransferase domain-containing protein [Candidatus Omnitrophota bacterium]|nr:methyltransferase domain-containing protein [Candidatus Omnitrophota bacterium]
MAELSDAAEIAKQLKRPSGDRGKDVGELMNLSNRSLYELAFSMLDLRGDRRLLEIGAGNGNFFPRFFEINDNLVVHAIDHSDTMCAEAERRNRELVDRGRLIIKCADALQMDIADDYFDKVLSINTIYFWPSVEKQLKEVRRVLRTGGQLLLGFRPKSVMLSTPYVDDGFVLYEKEQVAELLARNGFKLVKEKVQNITRKRMDGVGGESVDICILAEKI